MMNAMTMADVLVEPITLGDIRPLFPLMRAVEPELKLSAWLSYSRRMTKAKAGARAGIMVARRRGHSLPCGAVHYRLDRNLRYGQLLTAEHFIAIDLLYPHAVLAALFEALDGIATGCGCTAMRSILQDGRADLLDRLCVAGHRRDGMMLTKNF
jgi:hypothetical protein